MSDVKHTPLPWSIVPQNDGSAMIAHEYQTGKQMNPKGLRLIAHVLARGNSLQMDEANAAVIVAAVNAYATISVLCRKQHEALEKSLWRPRAQFPSNPYCALCGVGRNWAIDHGHERDCLITEYAALFPKTGGAK